MASVENLSLPRRQKVFDTNLVPAGDPLPIWTKLPLDSKLPVVPSPRGSYTLYTTKVGQPKYISKQHYDFDLNDPEGRARPGEYDSLHDPFLKTYFDNPRTRKQLLHNDLITRDGKIKCDVKEFNQFRDNESVTTADRLAMYGRDVSLVQRLRMRENTLMRSLAEKERERVEGHERRVNEAWEDRKRRQQRLLQMEEKIDERIREERLRHIMQREKTLKKQRDRLMAKLGKSKNSKSKGNNQRKHVTKTKHKEKEERKETKQNESPPVPQSSPVNETQAEEEETKHTEE
nr:hypothetical protein BaRGS_003705 [Batillaria attramentaria]